MTSQQLSALPKNTFCRWQIGQKAYVSAGSTQYCIRIGHSALNVRTVCLAIEVCPAWYARKGGSEMNQVFSEQAA